MHEYIQMSGPANVAYIAYCALCVGYGVFVAAASVFSPQYRGRIHRGTWFHVAEGWALVAVMWAACAWARRELVRGAHTWSGHPPTPPVVGLASVVYWLVLPLALTATFVMAITTLVRSAPAPTPPKAA